MDEETERARRPETGGVVAYFDLSKSPVGTVRRGVASGVEIADPGADEWWIPVRRTDGPVDLVPAALIIDVLPLED